jgi:SAM-dependent methyltransferase
MTVHEHTSHGEHAMAETTTPNSEVIRHWAEVEGPHYVGEAERYDTMLEAFGNAMFAAADLRPGERVLDIGCGTGATTVDAAARVRPGGTALGIDVSPPMLALARMRAEKAGVTTAGFVHADAQTHRFEEAVFDAAISRHGVMFFEDPDTTFANVGRALRRGGRIAFVAPQDLDHSEWIMVAGVAAAPHIGIPEGIAPNAPGPYGLADPDRSRGILERTGFTDIAVEQVTASMRIGADVDDAVGFLRSIPVVADLFAAAPEEKRTAAIDAVREALAPYAGPDGVVMHNNADWLITARRIE